MSLLSVKGWLSEAERYALVEWAAQADNQFRAPRFVNIGVEYGASLHCLRAASHAAQLYGIDLDNTKLEGDPRAELITGDSGSLAVVSQVAPPVHLLLIDGGHDLQTVQQDIALWVPKVVREGLILFHDYSTWELHLEVKQAVDEWAKGTPWACHVAQVDTLRVYRWMR